MAFEPSLFVVERLSGAFLAVMPRPVPGEWLEDSLQRLKEAGVRRVVSLLEEPEAEMMGLRDECVICGNLGMDFVSFPIKDRSVPSDMEGFKRFTEDLYLSLREGGSLAVHCRAGIGRATLVAVGVLLWFDYDVESALARVERSRGVAVPDTDDQRDWLVGYQRTMMLN